MIWVVAACGVLLFAAAIAVLYRIERGPSTLDARRAAGFTEAELLWLQQG